MSVENDTIRVMLIDDQEIFRLGLRIALRKYPDIQVDCEAGDGRSGLELVSECQPDVAIVDIWLPGMDGVEVAEQIQQLSPRTRIMLISGFFDDAAVARGLELGVGGIIAKTDSPKQFAEFIRRVHRGEFCCSAAIATYDCMARIAPVDEFCDGRSL
jgi:DNA-binding NarL/FixJ family response regulator